MTLYVPGTEETDLKKVIMSLQQLAAAIEDLRTPACFLAHKNAVDQTGIVDSTLTPVTFGTEEYDVGGHFASNAWTPPAGKVHMDTSVFVLGTVADGALILVAILKNGSFFRLGNFASSPLVGGGTGFVSCDDIATGTDVYTVSVFIDVTAGTGTVQGTVASTYFSGHIFST